MPFSGPREGRLLGRACFGGLIVALAPTALGAGASDFFAPLQELTTPTPNQPAGGQNFTRCCLQAMNDWTHGDPNVTISSSTNPSYVFGSSAELGDSGEQFPCGATYTGDDNGAPRVLVSYNWCASNCGGWQQSTNSVLTQWVQPLIGFVLPAAVFCLNVKPLSPPLTSLTQRPRAKLIILGSTEDGL